MEKIICNKNINPCCFGGQKTTWDASRFRNSLAYQSYLTLPNSGRTFQHTRYISCKQFDRIRQHLTGLHRLINFQCVLISSSFVINFLRIRWTYPLEGLEPQGQSDTGYRSSDSSPERRLHLVRWLAFHWDKSPWSWHKLNFPRYLCTLERLWKHRHAWSS